MKYALAIKGKRAERRFVIPLPGEDGSTFELACVSVPLTGDEEGEALAFALEYARGKNVKDPAPGDPLYDLGYMAKVVELAVRDPDEGTPGARPATFASTGEVLGELPRETITYVFAIVQEWADRCSPSARAMTDAQLFAVARELAKEGDDGDRFLDRCGPVTLRRFARFSARRLWPLLAPKSPSGGPSDDAGETTPSS